MKFLIRMYLKNHKESTSGLPAQLAPASLQKEKRTFSRYLAHPEKYVKLRRSVGWLSIMRISMIPLVIKWSGRVRSFFGVVLAWVPFHQRQSHVPTLPAPAQLPPPLPKGPLINVGSISARGISGRLTFFHSNTSK